MNDSLPSPQDGWFRIEVSDSSGQIVAIEPCMLAGRDIGDAEQATVLRAIRHLCAFIGIQAPKEE